MSRNGSGSYTLPSPFPSGFSNGTTIDAPTMNAILTDVQTALTASTAADGQTPITGSWDFNTKNLTNVGSFAASAGAFTNVTVANNTTTLKLFVGTAAGPTIARGAGAPVAVEPQGSLWLRTDGGVGTTLYVSQGAGTWNPVAGV